MITNINDFRKVNEALRKATYLEKMVFEYLNELRDYGATNMYGAVPYIVDEFNEQYPTINTKEATRLLVLWMKNFNPEGNYQNIEESIINEDITDIDNGNSWTSLHGKIHGILEDYNEEIYNGSYGISDNNFEQVTNEIVNMLNQNQVSESNDNNFNTWDDLFGILAWKYKPTEKGDMLLDGEATFNELKDKFELKYKSTTESMINEDILHSSENIPSVNDKVKEVSINDLKDRCQILFESGKYIMLVGHFDHLKCEETSTENGWFKCI